MTCNIQSDLVFCKSSSCVEAFSSQPAPNIIEKGSRREVDFFQMVFAKLWFSRKVWARKGFPLFSPLPPPSSPFPCSSWQFCNEESGRGEKVASSNTVEKIFWRRSEKSIVTFALTLKMIDCHRHFYCDPQNDCQMSGGACFSARGAQDWQLAWGTEVGLTIWLKKIWSGLIVYRLIPRFDQDWSSNP